jgi:hypothetical protein
LGGISKSAAGSLFCFFPAHAFAHQLLRPFFEVKTHLLGEIAVDFSATEDIR